MLSAKFGIEIEFTGITRERAARVAAEFLQGTYSAVSYTHLLVLVCRRRLLVDYVYPVQSSPLDICQ